MYTWETMDKTLDYIEEHLAEEIRNETLAGIAGLSLFYYQRLFKRLVRKTVQEYIKLRRLARAAEDLKDIKRKILDTALDYGFSDHANFTRAFRETYQITPEEYRKTQPMLNTFDRPQLSMNYIMADENVPLIADGIVLEIQRQVLHQPEPYLGLEKAVSIAGQVPAGESTGIDVPGELWREFHEKKTGAEDVINGGIELGMSHSASFETGTFLYFAGGRAVNAEAGRNGMVKRLLPAGEYIVCRIEAESFVELVTTALNQANRYLFEIWLKNRRIVTEPFSAEKYYKDVAECPCMEIWVKERGI
ncbi:helix-turn-helix domain-containing protein [Faecalicatena orotica]|uniref:AraC family transcriptional regulator n=1 Tax=Faecalicatena orotica TaxID=1544 RepID=A0A2Y9B9G7_9FIRM|nr:AraC family transcriptional regulator [Faecalicatena orotica]PWJ32231.1 AraC family transcriptional regulator [Faecalicatena orotica]SSA54064.1 AraC family transcriptional regulator [Faecalicatena orotica]